MSDTGAPVDPGVHHVVGTDADTVTLLRVGDADGWRVNTGDVVTVDRERLDEFTRAGNPAGNRSVADTVAGALEGVVLQVRAFLEGLAARPLASLVALALLVTGNQGDRVVSGPGAAFTAVSLVGVLALVYLGSRGG